MTTTTTKNNPREKSKTRAWEKDRRDRLSESFNKLREILPSYNASKPLSKLEVLSEATSTIKDLDEKLKVLILPDNDKTKGEKIKVSSEIIKKLQDRVKKLLVRNEELTNLLNNAGINVPSVLGSVKKFKPNYKLSNRITHGQAKVIQKEFEKENQVKPPKPQKTKNPKRNAKPKTKKVLREPKNRRSLKRQVTHLSSTNCLFIVSQPRIINSPSYIVSKTASKINQAVISNSFLVKTPIVSSNIKPSLFSTHPPGTLVLANGTVMPVVPTPPAIPVLPTIFTNPVQTNLPTIIVVSSNNVTLPKNKVSVSSCKKTETKSCTVAVLKTSAKEFTCDVATRPILRPKMCVTKTTQINKVPIPALSSQYNKHLCFEELKPKSDEKLCDTKSNKQKPVENISRKTKKVYEQAQKDAKKPKLGADENAKNMEKTPLTSTNNILHSDSTGDSKIGESVKFIESQKCLSQTLDNDKAEEGQSNDKCSKQFTETERKVLAFDMGQEIFTSPKKHAESTVTLDTIKKPNDFLNRETIVKHSTHNTIQSEGSNTCMIESKQANMSENCAKINVNENIINTSNCIKMHMQSKIHDNLEANCKMLTPTVLPSNVSSTSTCNKLQLNTLEGNISQADPLSKNPNTSVLKSLELNLPQSELSNDIFASFQVPGSCQNTGSTSPTAAFLLAFPLVSSGIKVTEVIGDENSESHAATPNLLQIGTMEMSKPTQSFSDSLTPSILNFENFSFFPGKDNYGGFYNNCGTVSTACQTSTVSVVGTSKTNSGFLTSTVAASSSNIINNNPVKHDNSEILKFPVNSKTKENEKSLNQPNNFKTNHTENVPANSKNSHINSHYIPTELPKDLKEQIYINSNTNYNSFDRNNSGNIGANTFDMNINSRIPKLPLNENYPSKCQSEIPEQTFISKPFDNCNNFSSNYRDCVSYPSNSTVIGKSHNPVYTSAVNNTYFYNNSSVSSGDNRNFNNTNNCNTYSDNKKSGNFSTNYNASPQVFQKEKPSHNIHAKAKPPLNQNKPINWMTSPSTTVSYKPDYFLPSFSKEHNFNSNLNTNTNLNTLSSNTYFNSSVYKPSDNLNNSAELRKTVDFSIPTYSSHQRLESDENQFSWSPSKMPQFVDPNLPHTFISSTLPTLVGDLALNTPILDQKSSKDKNRDSNRKVGNCDNQSNQTNFLSVSQLVEPNQEHIPAKVVSRRGSGNRSKTNTPKSKRVMHRADASKELSGYHKNDKGNQQKQYDISVASNLFNEPKQQARSNKNVPSSYSAEALIGNQFSTNSSAKRNIPNHNKSIVPNFVSDNIVSYFPSVDASQDNCYIQNNQNFQPNSFTQNFTTTFQNNVYNSNNFIPGACSIASTYLPNNNFMHTSSNAQDFISDNQNIFQSSNVSQNRDKPGYGKNYYRNTDKDEKSQVYNNCKKAKKKSIHENNLPSFDIPFLSMPGAINSPILPDDFHTTYLPPTTLYSCKNPLYSKANSEVNPNSFVPPLSTAVPGSKLGIQHSEMSPSVNSVGTSLTNFNLSTIFPEINKGPGQDNFSDARNKECNHISKSFSMTPSLQVPFSSKSSIPFGSFGT